MSDLSHAKPSVEPDGSTRDGRKVADLDGQSRLNDIVGADDYEAGAEEVQDDTVQGARKPAAPKPSR